MRQDQYELKGAVLEAPLEWQGLRLAPGRGGVLVTGLEGTDQRPQSWTSTLPSACPNNTTVAGYQWQDERLHSGAGGKKGYVIPAYIEAFLWPLRGADDR